MIILITGTPGSGKSLYATQRITEWVKEGREVYSDIDGLNIPEVMEIPDGDWQQTPKGSVVVYDEAQRNECFKYRAKEKLSNNTIISGMEYARHDGYDIVFITQSPKFLHLHLLELVGEHYHVSRPYGRAQAEICLHRQVSMMPNTVAAKERAEDVFKFKYDPKIFALYKSAEIHTHKFRLPKYFYKLFAIIAFCGIGASYILFGTDNKILDKDAYSLDANAISARNKKAESVKADVHDPLTPEQRADLEARSPVATDPTQNPVNQISYNPNQPFANQFDNAQAASNQPYLSGCMQLKNKCSCFTQQGSKLDVSLSDCKKVIGGDMPYNPFLTRSDSSVSLPVQSPPPLVPAV